MAPSEIRPLGVRALAVAAVAALAFVLGGGGHSAVAAEPLPGLAEQIDQVLADPRVDGSQAGVVVRDAETGVVLYDHNGDRRLVPASNNKLLTSVAGLEVLGDDHRFATTVLTDGDRRGPVLRGDLYLKGTGDPTMLEADYDDLAAKVAAEGITRVSGRLVADDTWLDTVRLGTEWGQDDLPFNYAAPVSALTVASDTAFDAATVNLEVRPGAAGAKPDVRTVPRTSHVTIVNRAVTGPAGGSPTIAVDRELGTNRLAVTGSIPAGSAVLTRKRSVHDPTGYATAVFRDALRRHGVRVDGTGLGATPDGADEIARRESITLGELLVPFLKQSNNSHAETLIKNVGRAASGVGSWPSGAAASRTVLTELGVDPATYRITDGAGLTRHNLAPAEQFTALLVSARSQPWFDTWYQALPVAGDPDPLVGGTLANRMRGTAAAGNVHAKTGTLTSVSALSGYVTNAAGRELAFAIGFNDYLSAAPKDLEDRIAVILATSGASGEPTVRTRADLARLPAPRLPTDDPATAVRETDLECSWVNAC